MAAESGGAATGVMAQMRGHMKMTESRPMTPEDKKRGEEVIKTARERLAKYQDYSQAGNADGYQPYMPAVPQEVYHFSSTIERWPSTWGTSTSRDRVRCCIERVPTATNWSVECIVRRPPTPPISSTSSYLAKCRELARAHECLPASGTY